MASQTKIEELSDDELRDDGKGDDKPKRQKRERKKPTDRADKDLHGRLTATLERLADTLAERGDDELADVLRDESGVMARGLVSFTRPFALARTLVLAVVALIEPVLAFGRVGRVLLTRWADRRAQRAEAAQTADVAPE